MICRVEACLDPQKEINMAVFDCELVGKIGSMALIRKEDQDIDYNIFSRLGAELKPGAAFCGRCGKKIS